SNICPRKSSPSPFRKTGAAADGSRATSAASSFRRSPSCEPLSTSATAINTGRSIRASGVINNVSDFDPPTVPKVPKAPKSLSHNKISRAASFLWEPKRVPAEKPLWHGHSGGLGGLGGGQVAKIFWTDRWLRAVERVRARGGRIAATSSR